MEKTNELPQWILDEKEYLAQKPRNFLEGWIFPRECRYQGHVTLRDGYDATYVYYTQEQKTLFDKEVSSGIDEKSRRILAGMWFIKTLDINTLEFLVKDALRSGYVSEPR